MSGFARADCKDPNPDPNDWVYPLTAIPQPGQDIHISYIRRSDLPLRLVIFADPTRTDESKIPETGYVPRERVVNISPDETAYIKWPKGQMGYVFEICSSVTGGSWRDYHKFWKAQRTNIPGGASSVLKPIDTGKYATASQVTVSWGTGIAAPLSGPQWVEVREGDKAPGGFVSAGTVYVGVPSSQQIAVCRADRDGSKQLGGVLIMVPGNPNTPQGTMSSCVYGFGGSVLARSFEILVIPNNFKYWWEPAGHDVQFAGGLESGGLHSPCYFTIPKYRGCSVCSEHDTVFVGKDFGGHCYAGSLSRSMSDLYWVLHVANTQTGAAVATAPPPPP
jgi:hypothetical protein